MTVKLRHRRFAVGVQQLGAVPDDAAVFLRHSRQKSRHILERHDRNVERIAEAHEARSLYRCVDVQYAGQHRGLIRHDADAGAAKVRKSAKDVAGVVLVHFIELAVVDHALDDVVHVVRLIGVVRDNVEQCLIPTIARITPRTARRRFEIVRRNEPEHVSDSLETRGFRVHGEVRNAGCSGMRVGTAQRFHRDVFVRQPSSRRWAR